MLAIRKAWKWAKARQTEQTGRLGSAASVDGGRSTQLRGGRTSRRWCPLRPKTFHVEKRKTESLPTEKNQFRMGQRHECEKNYKTFRKKKA